MSWHWKGDVKLKEKLTCGLKNDKESGQFSCEQLKVWKFALDGFLLWKACKVLDEKVQKSYLSWQWSDAKFEEKLALGFKNDMTNLVNFNASSSKNENLLLLSIAYIKFQLEKCRRVISHDTEEWSKLWRKYRRVVLSKITYGFKNDIGSLVNFHTSSWK